MIDPLWQVREYVDTTAVAAAHDSIEDWIGAIVSGRKPCDSSSKPPLSPSIAISDFRISPAWRR